MPPRKPRERIEIDRLFAPLPQDLLLDARISAPACRLWGVLFVFRWNGDPPDFDRLAAAMGTTGRSVYRWLQELEVAGWIDWDRHATLEDRFTLRTAPGGDEIDTSVNFRRPKLTPGSNDLTPGSEDLIVVSERLTQVSILDDFSGVRTPQNDPLQNHENHENHVGVGVGESRTLAAALSERGVNPSTVSEILTLGLDSETVIHSLDNMLADAQIAGKDRDQAIGQFVRRVRLTPPEKGKPYERQRVPGPGPRGDGPHGPGRANGSRNREREGARRPRPGDLAYYDRYAAGADGPADSE